MSSKSVLSDTYKSEGCRFPFIQLTRAAALDCFSRDIRMFVKARHSVFAPLKMESHADVL